MPKAMLFAALESLVPKLLPLSRAFAHVGLKRLVPVSNPKEILPLSERQRLEWSLLNTFDWLSPEFDHPQTPETVKYWLHSAGLEQIEVLKPKNVVGRGKMPNAPRH